MLDDARITAPGHIAVVLLAGLLVLTLLGAGERPATGWGFGAVSLVSGKAQRFLGDDQAASVLDGAVQHDRPVIHASFLLFDFKQNLRHWPVLAGDITRSPPVLSKR
jgi:hypothetical protein